jgi:hypothetical protein
MSAGQMWLVKNLTDFYEKKWLTRRRESIPNKARMLRDASAKMNEVDIYWAKKHKIDPKILDIAEVKFMDRSTGTNGPAVYYIPHAGKSGELADLLRKAGIKVKLHASALYARQVFMQVGTRD